jgi:hypothetical protein
MVRVHCIEALVELGDELTPRDGLGLLLRHSRGADSDGGSGGSKENASNHFVSPAIWLLWLCGTAVRQASE